MELVWNCCAAVKKRGKAASSKEFSSIPKQWRHDGENGITLPSMKTRTALLLAALILFAAGCLPAQVQLPDTPAAHQLSAGSPLSIAATKLLSWRFCRKNYPARAGEIDGEMGFREQTGGFDLKQAGDCGGAKCSAVVQERDPTSLPAWCWRSIPRSPMPSRALNFAPFPRPADFSITPHDRGGGAQSLHAYLDQAAAADRFSGAALVGEKWEAGIHRRLRHGRPGKEDS